MIPIKIQCGCGQKYAFDVEAPTGVMPHPVACPICGTDGTPAANLAIAQHLPPQFAGTPPPPPVHAAQPPPPPFSSSSSTVRRNAAGIPQIEPAQVVIEAKAKISWGDSPDMVIKFMMMNGFPVDEARSQVDEMFRDRAATIRKNGLGKMVMSVPLMCVPLGALALFHQIGMFSVKLFGLAMMVGLYGAWLLIKGAIMFISPRSESGDVADK
jgi:hypothetical protein